MARCSFDGHIEQIFGALTVGGTLIMLHPNGNMDYKYLYSVFIEKQISLIISTPSLLYAIFEFLQENNCDFSQIPFRSISAAGKLF
jgi:non-ribosomal peptide synthetase component F